MQYFSWSFKNFLGFASTLQHISLNTGSKVKKNSVYSIWNNAFCFFLEMVIFTTLKLDVENDNVVSTLDNVFHINFEIQNVDSTLFDVVNSNIELHNVVSTLIWRCPRRDIVLTKRHRWNNFEIFAGIDVWQDPKHASVNHQPNKMVKQTQKIRRLN